VEDPPGPTTTSRLAVLALVVFAVADVVRTVLAMGHYEHRIDSVTHGSPDAITPVLYAYLLVGHFSPVGAEPSTVGNRVWGVAALLACAAFLAWLYLAARAARRLDGTAACTSGWAVGGWFVPIANLAIPLRDVHRAGETRRQPDRRNPIGRWWTLTLLTVAFVVLRVLYDLSTARGGPLYRTQFDMRFVAYPLWTVATVLLVRTVNRSVRLIREVRLGLGHRPSGVGGDDPVP